VKPGVGGGKTPQPRSIWVGGRFFFLPQVSPVALKIQPLSGLSQVSPGVKVRGCWSYSFNNINPVGVEREEQEVKPGVLQDPQLA